MRGDLTVLGFALVLLAAGSGCSVLNPYRSDWKCPPLDNGQCVSVPEAYRQAVGKEGGDPTLPGYGRPEGNQGPCAGRQGHDDCARKDREGTAAGDAPSSPSAPPLPPVPSPAEEHRDAVYRRLAALAKEPKTPLLTPPGVWRLWVLPYEGENGDVLFGDRHVYVVVDRPRFLLGEALERGEREREGK